MKNLFLLSTALYLMLPVLAQKKESFDIVSYTAPKDWAKSNTAETVIFTKDGGNQYCVISLCKSIDATADAQQNFDNSWQVMATTSLGAGAVTMQPGSTDNGWETKIGSAPFDKDGLTGSAILISSSKNNKQVNILILTNTDAYLKEMEAFLESVDLKSPDKATVVKPSQTNNTANNNAGQKAEIWWSIRYMPKSFSDATQGTKPVIDYYVVYPNGDYYPDMPLEGLTNFSKATHNNDSWGKLTLVNGTGSFKNKYDEIKVERISATELKKVGYTHSFHKAVSVDGLKLEGTWGPYPGWSKEAHYKEPGCKMLISFKKDGTFVDRGAFVSNTSLPYAYPDRAPGKGTYSINNFTLVLKYDDGRTIYKAFGGGTKNPAIDDETIFIGTTPLNKK